MLRNDLNYWNGKVQNMRRDMEMQQQYNVKVVGENRDLRQELTELRRDLEL